MSTAEHFCERSLSVNALRSWRRLDDLKSIVLHCLAPYLAWDTAFKRQRAVFRIPNKFRLESPLVTRRPRWSVPRDQQLRKSMLNNIVDKECQKANVNKSTSPSGQKLSYPIPGLSHPSRPPSLLTDTDRVAQCF